ncbi:hypothetical protein, partial [Clostridium botulinum]|uniref:hypothetical protein n=1 Tax=Clostridium botulinum TaxID=1491 RepID=UPI0019689CFB
MKKLDEFFTIIDSMEIKLKLSNINDLSKINMENYPYIKKDVRINSKQTEIVIPLSLNRRQGHYNRLTTLSENRSEFQAMLKDFGVIMEDDVKLNRIDIALDSNLNFDYNFKYFLYMFELCTYSNKKADKWYTTNLNTLRNNSIKQNGRKFQTVFYD